MRLQVKLVKLIGEPVLQKAASKKVRLCVLLIGEYTEPLSFMVDELLLPGVEQRNTYRIPVADSFNGLPAVEIYSQHAQDKGKAVVPVRCDEIRKDCVSVAAGGALDPENLNFMTFRFSVDEVDEIPPV